MNKVFFIFFFALITLVAKAQNTIVIIFFKPSALPSSLLIDKHRLNFEFSDVVYLADSSYKVYHPSYNKVTDTLKIVTQGKYVLFKHKYKVVGYLDYFLTKGDTALVKYSDGKPWMEIVNRKVKHYDLNYDLLFRAKHMNSDFYSGANVLSLYNSGVDIINKSVVINNFKTREAAYKVAKESFSSEGRFLDSISKANAITNAVYDYYNKKLELSIIETSITSNKDNLKATTKLIDGRFDSFFYKSQVENILNKILYQLYSGDAYLIKTKTETFYDARLIYEKLDSSKIFSENQKNILFKMQLINIAKNFSVEDLVKYLNKYKAYAKEPLFIYELETRYITGIKNPSKNFNTQIIDKNHKELSWGDMLKLNRGKVVYIDFWASWCIPCRESMQASRILRLRNKDIVFIYVSIDKLFENWIKATEEDGIYNYGKSYQMLSYSIPDFLKINDIGTIPRYFIFNKAGILIDNKAPHPTDPKLELILKSMVKQRY